MAGLAIITEACIDVKDRACVDVCPVQCIYELDSAKHVLFSEVEAGSGIIETTHAPRPDAIAVFGDSILDVNLEECTSCTACYQPDVCPVGAIYSEESFRTAPRQARSTTRKTRTRAMTTRSSSSTAGTSSRTRASTRGAVHYGRQGEGGPARRRPRVYTFGQWPECSDQVVEVRDGSEWRRPFAGARRQSDDGGGCHSRLCGVWRPCDAHRAVHFSLATSSGEREPVEHLSSGGA